MPKRLKVLLLFDAPEAYPKDHDYAAEFKTDDWETEADVYKALRENGYKTRLLGIHKDINTLMDEIRDNRPDVVFNLTEVFAQQSRLDKNIAWMLDMFKLPYTGASPMTLLLCNHKGISKKILSFHKIKVPHFHTFYRRHRIRLPKRVKLPVVVKPLCEEASRGISLASVTDNMDAFQERIQFIHQSMNMDAIAEEYIDGRELYVGVIGNKRVNVFPPREMLFGQFLEDEPRIATYKAKWDEGYRKKYGIKSVFPGKLPNGLSERIEDICKRAYRAMDMQAYARFDIRVTPDNQVYILEVNANPCLAKEDEVGFAADKAGMSYDQLIQRIIKLAFQRTS